MSQKITVSKDVHGTLFLPSLGDVVGSQEIYIQDNVLKNKDIQGAIAKKLLILGDVISSNKNNTFKQENILQLNEQDFIKIVNKKNNDLCFDAIKIDANSSIYSKGQSIMTSFAKIAINKGLIQVFDRNNNKILINNMGQFYKQIANTEKEPEINIQIKKEVNEQKKQDKVKNKKNNKKNNKKTIKEKDLQQQEITQQNKQPQTQPLIWNINDQKPMDKNQSFKQVFAKKKQIEIQQKEKQDGNKKLKNIFKSNKNIQPEQKAKQTVKNLISKLNKKSNNKNKKLPSISSMIKENIKNNIEFVDQIEKQNRISSHKILSQLNNNSVE